MDPGTLSSEYQLPALCLGSFADTSQGPGGMLVSMLRLRVPKAETADCRCYSNIRDKNRDS